jgi:hypothetical protein
LTAKNFDIPDQRDAIMKAIFVGIEMDDEEVQENSLHCLAETPSLGY